MGEFERVSLPPPPRGGGAETSGGNDAGDEGSLAGPDGLPGVGGTDGFGGFGRSFLTDAVGRGQINRPEDVFQASSFLAANSLLPAPTRNADESFLRGIEQGQERLSSLAGGGLFVDGIAKPWGPTEMLSQRAVTSGRMTTPAAAPDRTPAQQTATARRLQTQEMAGNVAMQALAAPPTPKPLSPLLAAPEGRPSATRQIAATGAAGARQPAASRDRAVPLGRPVHAGPPNSPPPVPLYREQILAKQPKEWIASTTPLYAYLGCRHRNIGPTWRPSRPKAAVMSTKPTAQPPASPRQPWTT